MGGGVISDIQNELDNKINTGDANARLSGLFIGDEGQQSYIYNDENDYLMFRYLNSNGETNYTNMAELVDSIYVANLNMVKKSDVVNNLESTVTTLPLSAYQGKVLNDKITDISTSFQDGCSTIADAITDMGVTTASNASPETMADNIRSIETSATALTWTSETINASSTGSLSDHFYYGNFSTGVTGKTLYKNLFFNVISHNGHGGGTETVIAEATYTSSTGVLYVKGYYSEPTKITIWYTT